jgi:hypothetical protein
MGGYSPRCGVGGLAAIVITIVLSGCTSFSFVTPTIFTPATDSATVSIATVPVDENWVIRQDGVGPAKIGMTLPRLNAALHEKFSMPKNKEEQKCFYVQPTNHEHTSFMIENGRLVRVDVDAAGIPTNEGVQVGDSEEHIRDVYGARLRVEPRGDSEDRNYLTVRSKDGRYGVRFEPEKGKILHLYAGLFKPLQRSEGCS